MAIKINTQFKPELRKTLSLTSAGPPKSSDKKESYICAKILLILFKIRFGLTIRCLEHTYIWSFLTYRAHLSVLSVTSD